MRALCGFAIAVDLLLAALPFLVYAAVDRKELDWFFAAFCAGAFLVACTSVAALALMLGAARRSAFWAVMLVNGLVLAAFMLLFAWLGPNLEFGLAFIVPALLNMAAAGQLRRARTR